MSLGQRFLGILAAVLLLGLGAAAPCLGDAPRISKEELRELLGRPDVVVVDVRTGRDWRRSDEWIAGAVREDPGAVSSWAGKYGKDTTLVLYCT